FDQTYPWAYFRRHNREYYFRTLASQTTARYFQRLRAYHWQVATNIARSTTADLGSDDDDRPYVVAQSDIFDTLTRAIMMPEPGVYSSAPARRPVDALQDLYDTTGPAQTSGPFTINIVDGRFVAEDYDNDLGGSWDYIHFVNHAGFGVEKEN